MHQDDTTTHDRRKDNQLDVVLVLVRQIHDSQLALDQKFTRHIEEETTQLAASIAKLMSQAFPEGDPDGHRRHHLLVIAREEAKVKFWNEMVTAGAKWAGLGVLGFLATAVWFAIKAEVHK